jgi:predicted DNA-binding transcriptional regulator AlpA
MSERRARRMVRGWKGVYPYIPLGETQLKERIKEGKLKPPTKIGPRAIAWFEDELAEAQALFEAERDEVE